MFQRPNSAPAKKLEIELTNPKNHLSKDIVDLDPREPLTQQRPDAPKPSTQTHTKSLVKR